MPKIEVVGSVGLDLETIEYALRIFAEDGSTIKSYTLDKFSKEQVEYLEYVLADVKAIINGRQEISK